MEGFGDTAQQQAPASVGIASLANHSITVTASLMKDKSSGLYVCNEQKYGSGAFNHRVLEYLQESLHFNLSWCPASNAVDAPVNGTWTGSGALLRNGTADLSIDLSVLVPFRGENFVLPQPIFLDKVSLFFRQPPASSMRDIFTDPFTTGVWLTLIGCFLLAWIVLMLIPRTRKEKRNKSDQINNSSLLWLTSIYTCRGWPYKRANSCASRIALFTGSIMCLFLNIIYSANLVSLFSVPTKPINNLAQFMSSGLPIIASTSSDTVRNIFNNSMNTPTNPGMSKAIQYVPSTRSYELPMDKTVQYPSALLTFPYRFYTESRKISPWPNKPLLRPSDDFYCKDITELEAMNTFFQTGWILSQKSSHLREPLNGRTIGLYESGLLWRQRKAYVNSYRPPCGERAKTRAFVDLTITDTFTAFLTLGVGIGLSIIVGIVEKLIGRKQLEVT